MTARTRQVGSREQRLLVVVARRTGSRVDYERGRVFLVAAAQRSQRSRASSRNEHRRGSGRGDNSRDGTLHNGNSSRIAAIERRRMRMCAIAIILIITAMGMVSHRLELVP